MASSISSALPDEDDVVARSLMFNATHQFESSEVEAALRTAQSSVQRLLLVSLTLHSPPGCNNGGAAGQSD